MGVEVHDMPARHEAGHICQMVPAGQVVLGRVWGVRGLGFGVQFGDLASGLRVVKAEGTDHVDHGEGEGRAMKGAKPEWSDPGNDADWAGMSTRAGVMMVALVQLCMCSSQDGRRARPQPGWDRPSRHKTRQLQNIGASAQPLKSCTETACTAPGLLTLLCSGKMHWGLLTGYRTHTQVDLCPVMSTEGKCPGVPQRYQQAGGPCCCCSEGHALHCRVPSHLVTCSSL